MKKVIILPFDGYATGENLLEAIEKVLSFAEIKNLVAFIKLNDGVHNPDVGGPTIVERIKSRLIEIRLEIGFFLDLKAFDVSATLVNVLKKYIKNPPDILTISSGCSVKSIIELRRLLPETKLAMISVPTDIDTDECLARFGQLPVEKILTDLEKIRQIYQKKISLEDNPEPFDLIVCSPHEVSSLKMVLPEQYGFIVPGIRDEWMKKADEHQKRTTGVREALENGATYVVMGAQLTKGNPENGITAEESCRLTEDEISRTSTN